MFYCITLCFQAELRPIDESSDRAESTQTDEEEMGMTYAELGVYGYLRKIMKCGPVRMFLKLVDMWRFLTPDEVAVKVSSFFQRFLNYYYYIIYMYIYKYIFYVFC